MSLVAVGDNVVDCYPSLGRMFPGGNAYNVAVMARRHGLPSSYVGAVGTDVAGRLLGDVLRTEQVDVERLRVVDGPTATATVELVDNDRVFVGSTTGVSFFTLDDDDLDHVGRHDYVHSSYCSGMEDQLGRLAERAPLAFDFSDNHGDDYAGALLPHCTIAAFSASDLDADDVADLVAWARSLGPRIVLATRGAAGAVFHDGTRLHHTTSNLVEVRDTLGAGDAFFARVLVGLATGQDPADFLPAAAASAAETCTHYGALGYGHALDGDITSGGIDAADDTTTSQATLR